MADVDYEAQLKANKILTVIAIISILIGNSALIVKLCLQKGFLFKPRDLTLISLAIADLFLALFSLVVNARLLFELQDYTPLCSTKISATVYNGNVLHFVYGTGLVALAVEMVQRNKSGWSSTGVKELSKALLYSSSPWVLAVVVMLPLCMADIDWEDCTFGASFTTSRNEAQVYMSIIVPATAALTACTAALCVGLNSKPDDTTQLIALSPHTNDRPQGTPAASENGIPRYESTQITNHTQGQSNGSENSGDDNGHGFPVRHAGQFQEGITLMWVSAVFFACTVPNAFYTLRYQISQTTITNNLDPLSRTIFSELCSWFMIFRSVVTPVIWIAWGTERLHS